MTLGLISSFAGARSARLLAASVQPWTFASAASQTPRFPFRSRQDLQIQCRWGLARHGLDSRTLKTELLTKAIQYIGKIGTGSCKWTVDWTVDWTITGLWTGLWTIELADAQ